MVVQQKVVLIQFLLDIEEFINIEGMYDRFDNSNGSLQYIEFYEETTK